MGVSYKSPFQVTDKLPYVKPLYTIDYTDDMEFIDWIKEADRTMELHTRGLFFEQRENLAEFFFFGGRAEQINLLTSFLPGYANRNVSDNIKINELFRTTMDQVSLIVSNELVPEVLPASMDYEDKQAAKYSKEWLDSMSYELDIDDMRSQWEIQKKIFGECFVIPEWNEELGSIHPMVKELEGEGLLDELLDVEDLDLSKDKRTGDIELINPLPFDVQIEPVQKFSNANWFWYNTYESRDYLTRKYPNKNFGNGKQKITNVEGKSIEDENMVKVYHFYHRSHEFLPEGRKIVCTQFDVLSNKSMKNYPSLIDARKLPLSRFMDSNAGMSVRGQPMTYRNLKPIVRGYDKITNQIYNNLEAETPKVMVHETSGVDLQRMPNGIVVMEWKGNHKPDIKTPTANSSGIFNFRGDLKKNILEMGFQNTMTRGETPNAQLDSFIALQYFEDLRNQLAAPDLKDHMKGLRTIYKLMISIAADHYDYSEKRLIKIVGEGDSMNLKYFNPENLLKAEDVRIKSTGNMANSRAARSQQMITIKDKFPQIIPDDMLIDQLGLSSNNKFWNTVTAAINSAEAENTEMANGNKIPEAKQYEDLIAHWDVHRIFLQTLDYKESPKHVKELFEHHVTGTEKLMVKMASNSETFALRVSNLSQFPLFYQALADGIDEERLNPVEELPPEEGVVEEETIEEAPEMAGANPELL